MKEPKDEDREVLELKAAPEEQEALVTSDDIEAIEYDKSGHLEVRKNGQKVKHRNCKIFRGVLMTLSTLILLLMSLSCFLYTAKQIQTGAWKEEQAVSTEMSATEGSLDSGI